MSCINCTFHSKIIRSYTNISNLINLYNCFFTRFFIYEGFNNNSFSYNSNCGSILYCFNILSILNINECIFFRCISTGEGGAIFFYCQIDNSAIYLNKICANECYCNISSQFGLFRIQNNILFNNFLNLISITKCGISEIGITSLRITYGNQSLNYLNSTNNYCRTVSSLFIDTPNKFIGKYCLIKNNKSFQSTIYLHIWKEELNIIRKLLYFNVIQNYSPNLGVVITAGYGSYNISHSNFILNQNILFFIQNISILFLDNSFVDNNLYNGTLITNNLLNNLINLNMNYFTTIYCEELIFTYKIIPIQSSINNILIFLLLIFQY